LPALGRATLFKNEKPKKNMELVTPAIGLVFWMLVTFSLLLFILKKFAWKPILSSMKEREETIEKSLQEAANARAEMQKLNQQNESLLAEARAERENILKEAREIKEMIVGEAKKTAEEEAKRMIERANEEISRQKNAAMDDLKKEVAHFSMQIAQKLVEKELENNDAQKALIATQLSQLDKQQTASA
jgi:F-type H+-transporting ATPase subunit b